MLNCHGCDVFMAILPLEMHYLFFYFFILVGALSLDDFFLFVY